MKAILFDLDDTLIESMHVWEIAITHLFKTLQIDMDIKEARDIFHKMKLSEVLTYIKNRFDLSVDEKWMFQEIQKDVYDQYAYDVQIKKGALEYIQKCNRSNIQMVVLTSNAYDLTEIVLKRLGLLPYIQTIYSAESLHMSKQKPEIYEYVLNELNMQACDVIVFEDSLYAIETAQSLGIRCIGLENNSNREIFKSNKIEMIIDFTYLL